MIDFDLLLDRLGGDRELLIKVIEVFLQNYESLMIKLESAVKAEDIFRLEDSAHSLKGALQSLNLNDIAGLVYQLEEQGREGAISGADRILEEIRNKIQEALPALQAALK